MPPDEDRASHPSKSRFEANPILDAWPRQAFDATIESSTINCAVMLLRHLNKELSDESLRRAQIENEHNLIHKVSMDQDPPSTADAHKKLLGDLKASGLIATEGGTDAPPTFVDLMESTQMLATTWSRKEQLLFCTFKKVGAEKWKLDNDFDREHGAKQSPLKIERFGDLVPNIEGQCKVSPVTEEPKSYREVTLRPPQNIRVQYTPRVGERETISTIQSFKLKLKFGGNTQFLLTAAVRARDPQSEGDFDRIRLFKANGYDCLPPEPYPYADGEWDVGLPGHTYHLYYARNDRQFVDLSEARRGRIRQHHFNTDLQAWDDGLKKGCERLSQGLLSAPPRHTQASTFPTPGPVSSQQSTQSSISDYLPTPQRGPRYSDTTPRTPKSQSHHGPDRDRPDERVYRDSYASGKGYRDSSRASDMDDRQPYNSGRHYRRSSDMYSSDKQDRHPARTRERDDREARPSDKQGRDPERTRDRDDRGPYTRDSSPKRRRTDSNDGQARDDRSKGGQSFPGPRRDNSGGTRGYSGRGRGRGRGR